MDFSVNKNHLISPLISSRIQGGHHLSNKERKAEAKVARKQRKREAGSGKTHEPKGEPFGSMAI